MKDILVITATLGNRPSLKKTIESVKEIGGERVHHIIVCPESRIEDIKKQYGDIECLAEPIGGKGIYSALNHGFRTYGHDYKYLTFINDDDFWLPNYRLLIDAMEADESLFMVYGKTQYVNEYGIKIGSQACSNQFNKFGMLLKKDIVLLTQQASLIKSELYFKLGGFDESYSLIADTKFWLEASNLKIKYRYLNKECAAYTIQEGQLSSNHDLQRKEHIRLLEEVGIECKSHCGGIFKFRLSNVDLYFKRCFKLKGYIKKPYKGNKLINFAICILPWNVKRYILNRFYLFDLSPKARIGLSYVFPTFLKMEDGATIGHLNVIINLEKVVLFKKAEIGRQNWVTGFPKNDNSFFANYKDRKPWLIMHDDSVITKEHLVDCTDKVEIGALTSIGGYKTQILTHSTSLKENMQSCAPIIIGHHSFVGTGSIILPGSKLPERSVLGAGSVLNKHYSAPLTLYAGAPARAVKELDNSYKFLYRTYRPVGTDNPLAYSSN